MISKIRTSAVIAGMIVVLAIAAFASIGFSTAAFASGGKSAACPKRGTAGTGDPHYGDEQSGNHVSQYDSEGFTIFPTKSSEYMSGYRAGVIQADKDVQ
jgi:hypothetical protein